MKHITAFHGTGCWDSIKRDGFLNPVPEDRSYDSTEGSLESCGGVYLTSSPEIATSYALRSAREFGGDETIIAVEINERLLIPDEDKVGVPIRNFLDDIVGRSWDRKSSREVAAIVKGSDYNRVRQLARTLGGSHFDDDFSILIDGVCGYAMRATEDGEMDPETTAISINRLCGAYRAAATSEWFSRYFGREDQANSFRTFASVGRDDGTRILGAATLLYDNRGLTMTGVQVDGDFPRDQIERIVAASVERLSDDGIEILVDFDVTSPETLSV